MNVSDYKLDRVLGSCAQRSSVDGLWVDDMSSEWGLERGEWWTEEAMDFIHDRYPEGYWVELEGFIAGELGADDLAGFLELVDIRIEDYEYHVELLSFGYDVLEERWGCRGDMLDKAIVDSAVIFLGEGNIRRFIK